MIDKIELARELFLNDPVRSIKDIFDEVEQFEKEAIKRGWVVPEYCEKCLAPYKYIDLSTAGHPQYECRCTCSKGRGETTAKALQDILKDD